MDTGASGGFLVPAQFRDELLRVDPASAIVRPRARVIPAGSPPDASVTFPALDQSGTAPANMYGGVDVQWIGEGEAKPDTDATFREITLEPHEVAGNVTVTDRLLRNWQAAGATIGNLLRDAVTAAEDRAFISGNGVAKPMGFINAAARHLVTRDTSAHITFTDVKEMHARLLRRGGMPAWIASYGAMVDLTGLRNLEDGPVGDGALVWQASAREGSPDRLMGYPVIWSERSPALGSIGDLALVDLSMYLIKDGSGPFVAASEHVLFKSNKTVIKIYWHVDGKPWLTAPMQLESGYLASPFVVLGLP
jgi:HK97 family phage major capsid protein